VHAIAFSPDSKTLAVSGGCHSEEGKSSGALRLFPLELEAKVMKAENPTVLP
jgi:hypothetical protein